MARRCLATEQSALEATAQALDERFVALVRALQKTVLAGGKLLLTGVGKNAPIGQKIAGTFNSTGVPTVFLDPNQALHGDLGLCAQGDLAVLLSHSGETEEMLRLLPFLQRSGVETWAMTGTADSTLAQHCQGVVTYHIGAEACPLNLAPTASTTAALALGDALAMVYLELRGLTKEDFARYHPAGSLGKALLLRVEAVMRTGTAFACEPEDVSVHEALTAMTRARCGTVALVDPASGRLTGVFSDGDFRRAVLRDEAALHHPARDYMTPHPVTIPAEVLAVEALKRFEAHAINDLIVVDAQGAPLGLLDGQDLPRLRLV